MIIVDNNNNISIRGFFLYSPSAKYEDGDFVVYGNTIFVCSPRSGSTIISNEIPSESDNFYVYLGDQLADISEFLDYSENGGGEKKYISLSSLPVLLNNFMTGLTNSGIIGDTISYDGSEESFIVSVKEIDSHLFFNKDTVLFDIMMWDNINHGIFKVSRFLPEIREYVYNDSELRDLDDYCILKQYSYLDSKGSLVRVQELIDHSNGFIFYRSSPKLNNGESNPNPIETTVNTSFKFATIHTKDLQKKANNLFRVYSSRLRGFESRLEDLQENFRFKGISLPDRKEEPKVLKLQENNPKDFGYVDSLEKVGPITITVLTKIYNSLNPTSGRYAFESNSLTIDPLFGDVDYYVKDDLFLSVNVTYTGVAEETEGSYRKVTVQNLSDSSINCGRGFINLPEEMDSVETLSTIELGGITEMYLLIKSTSLSNTEIVDPHCKISIIYDKLFENNPNLDFIAFDYSIYNDQGNLLGGPYTAIFRKNGLSETWVQEYDINRSSHYKDESLNYLITYSDLSKNSENIISFSEKSVYKFKIENKLSTSLYYSGFLSDNDSLNTGLEFELNSSSEPVEFFGFKNRDDRGIYFFSKEEYPEYFEIIIETKDGQSHTLYSSISPNSSNYYGSYKNPLISFKTLYTTYGGDCIIKLNNTALPPSEDDNIPDDDGGGSNAPGLRPTPTTGTITLKNNSEVSLYWYLVDPKTSKVISKYSTTNSLTEGSEDLCKYPHYGKINGNESIELRIGESTLDYKHIIKKCDIKIFRALEEDNSNYNISATLSLAEKEIIPANDGELLTIPWEDITKGEVVDIFTEKADKPKPTFKLKLTDLFSDPLEESFKITVRQSIRLSYVSNEEDDIDKIFETIEFFKGNEEKDIINHKELPSFITIEKSPIDSSNNLTPNNYFYIYKFRVFDSYGESTSRVSFPYLDLYNSTSSKDVYRYSSIFGDGDGDNYFYNFIYNEPEKFNFCRGSLKLINNLRDNSRIEFSNYPYYWINLYGGSSLENSISISTESSGKCFTEKNDEMISPITIRKGDYQRIKVYRRSDSFLKDFQLRLFLSTPEYQISIVDSENKINYTGKPYTLSKSINSTSEICKYGDVHFVEHKYLSDNCTVILGAGDTDISNLGKIKYIRVVNNDSWIDHSESYHRFYYQGNEGENPIDLKKDKEVLIPLHPGQNIVLSENDSHWPGHLGVSSYEFHEAKGVDILLKDFNGNIKFDTTYFKAGENSWNYGTDRISFIGYSDLSETSIDENTPDIITITPPSLSTIDFIKPNSGSKGGHGIKSSLHITENFNIHSDIWPEATSISGYESIGISKVYFYKKRGDRGLWFSGLKEKITFDYINEIDRKPFEIPEGIKLYPKITGSNAFSEIPEPYISDNIEINEKVDVTYNYGSYETPVIQWGKLIELGESLNLDKNLYKINVIPLSNQIEITNDSELGVTFVCSYGQDDYAESKILCNNGFSGKISYPVGVDVKNSYYKIPLSLDFGEITNPVAIDVSINPNGPYESGVVPTMTIFYDPKEKRKYLWDSGLFRGEYVDYLVTTDELGENPSIMLSTPSLSGYYMSISESLKNKSSVNTILTGFNESGIELTEDVKFINNVIFNNYSITPHNPSSEFSDILPDSIKSRDSFGLTFKSEVSKIRVYIKKKGTDEEVYKSDVIWGELDNNGYYKFGTLENPIISYKTLLSYDLGYYLYIDSVITSPTTPIPTRMRMMRTISSEESEPIRIQFGKYPENRAVYNKAKSYGGGYGPVVIYDEYGSGIKYSNCYLYGEYLENEITFIISAFIEVEDGSKVRVAILDEDGNLSETSNTTPAPIIPIPTPPLPPSNPIGSILESLSITLSGDLANESFIDSIYYRKFFKR